jgi:hypothetical protein
MEMAWRWGASQLSCPHPKSRSHRERDLAISVSLFAREKGLGDAGSLTYKSGIHFGDGVKAVSQSTRIKSRPSLQTIH